MLADFDPNVVSIRAQPFLLAARIAGRVRRHVPDFLLGMRDGTVAVVNVKPERRLGDPKVSEALAWPGELVRQHGWGYEVWSGCDPVVLDNVRFLAAYRRRSVVSAQEMATALAAVRDGEELVVAERRIADGMPPYAVRPALLGLVWSGRVTVDLTQVLSGTSVLRIAR